MKAGVLRLVDAKRVPMAGMEPGLPDIFAWLREHPASYLALIEQTRIAREWERNLLDGEWHWSRPYGHRSQEGSAGHVSPRTDGLWDARIHGFTIPGPFATAEEARDAVDADLRSAGFTLANPARSSP